MTPSAAKIEHELFGNALQAVSGLHDSGGDVEGLQVVDQVAAVCRLLEPATQLGRIGAWQLEPDFVGQLDNGLWSKPAVEVIVQRDFWQLLDIHFKP
jgi:hypothetical protein